MKKFYAFILTFIFVSNFNNAYSQDYISYIPAYYEIGITTKLIDSLSLNGCEKFLLYQTTISSDLINIKLPKRNAIEVTFFIWKDKEIANCMLFSDSFIFKKQIIDNTIFGYRNIDETWLMKNEDIYQLVAPFNTPYKKDIVIYKEKGKTRMFEIGKNLSYKLDLNKEKYRFEFIALIKSSVKNLNGKWEFVSSYDRMIDFPEAK